MTISKVNLNMPVNTQQELLSMQERQKQLQEDVQKLTVPQDSYTTGDSQQGNVQKDTYVVLKKFEKPEIKDKFYAGGWITLATQFEMHFKNLNSKLDKFYDNLNQKEPDIVNKTFDLGFKNNELVVESDDLTEEEKNKVLGYLKGDTSLTQSLAFFGRDMYPLLPNNPEPKVFMVNDFQNFIDKKVQEKLDMFDDIIDPIARAQSMEEASTPYYEQGLAYFEDIVALQFFSSTL